MWNCKILVPFDFSPNSEHALETARKLCRSLNAELHLVHVLPDTSTTDARRIALEQLLTVALPSQELQMVIHREVLHGSIRNELIAYARQHRIDMIVVGSRGRSEVLSLAMGSVTQSLLRNAICPVVVVNPESETVDPITDPADTKYLEVQHSESAAVDLVSRSISLRATDIHIDPVDEGLYQIRLRIDGKVKNYCELDRTVAEHLIHQYMTMAQIDFSDPFHPREGRLKLPTNMSDSEIRVTTSPVAGGYAVAMRLFSKENVFLPLEQLGFSSVELPKVRGMLQGQEGLVLVSGPTGSGKTTTVYSMLESFGGQDRNIVSIEDPVESKVDFVRQMNVDERHGLTMTSGLRTILRMDPDVIFIGEIRDPEAAQIALRAASSGVFVFSSLHARDIATTIGMLRELGATSRTLGSALAGVVNQRLVRRLCTHCRKAIPVDAKGQSLFLENGIDVPEFVYQPTGCPQCRGTGYYGRTGVFEIASCQGPIADAITQNVSEPELRSIMLANGVTSLFANALTKVKNGITCIEEAMSARWM